MIMYWYIKNFNLYLFLLKSNNNDKLMKKLKNNMKGKNLRRKKTSIPCKIFQIPIFKFII